MKKAGKSRERFEELSEELEKNPTLSMSVIHPLVMFPENQDSYLFVLIFLYSSQTFPRPFSLQSLSRNKTFLNKTLKDRPPSVQHFPTFYKFSIIFLIKAVKYIFSFLN
jgi:hypothetical protein